MPRPTLGQYEYYMKGGPRTYGWGVLLVYDRFKTNRLLAQEHIENLDLGQWIPPVNFVEEVDGLTTTVSNLQLDRPRLSFANSSLGASRARLSMNVIGGLITQVRRQPGSDQDELVSYSQLDLLTAPTVRMDVFLNESNQGNVSEEGRVTFDLAKGASYTFEVSSWNGLNEKLGEAISKQFQGWAEEDRVWELNVLKPIDGQLNPTAFEVRTHSFAKAQQITNATQDENEEGAVIVGVAFDGKIGGGFPGQDSAMPYLLPSPANEGEQQYSMNLIYSNEVWLKDVLFALIGKFTGLQNLKIERNHYGFYGEVTATFEVFVKGDTDPNVRHYWLFSIHKFKWPDLTLYGELRIQHQGDSLTIELSARTDEKGYVVEFLAWDGISVMRPTGLITAKMKGGLQFNLATDASRLGEIDVVADPVTASYTTKFWGSEYSKYDDYTKEAAEDYVMVRVREATDKLLRQFDSLAETKIPFNLLRLNGLLFRGANVATPRTLLLPGDLSLLGDLSPKLTTFAIEPLESVVSTGQDSTVTLKLNPAPSGAVDWQVKTLEGETVGAGTIVNGVYTPPAAESISGTYKRVIATATASGSTSSALITVVPNSVSIYPYFLIAQFKSPDKPAPRYVLVGGDIKNELVWSMDSGSKGSQRLPVDDDSDLDIPTDKNVRIYVSPEKEPGQAGEVEALVHLDRVQVSAGGLTQWIDVIIPWTTASARVKSTTTSNGGLQLAIVYDNAETGEEEELKPEETKWKVLLGKSTVDPQTGIYQPAADEGPYIIVAGRETPAERIAIWGYKVLVLSADPKRAIALAPNSAKEIQL